MKRIVIIAVLFSCAAHAFSQETGSSPSLTKEDYLRKSRHQKVAGAILVPIGGLACGIGTLIALRQATDDVTRGIDNIIGGDAPPRKNDQAAVATLLITGTAAFITGIGLLISSGKNAKKAKAMALSVKPESLWCLQGNSFTYRTLPSVSLKVHL